MATRRGFLKMLAALPVVSVAAKADEDNAWKRSVPNIPRNSSQHSQLYPPNIPNLYADFPLYQKDPLSTRDSQAREKIMAGIRDHMTKRSKQMDDEIYAALTKP